MINNRTDAWKTDVNLLIHIGCLVFIVVRTNKSNNNGIMILKIKIKFGKVTQISLHALISPLHNEIYKPNNVLELTGSLCFPVKPTDTSNT